MGERRRKRFRSVLSMYAPQIDLIMELTKIAKWNMNFQTVARWEPSLKERTDADMLPGDRKLVTLILRWHHGHQVGKLR